MSSKKDIIKKKKIIILLCIAAVILILAIAIVSGLLIYNFANKENAPQSGNVNTLDVGEYTNMEENNILQVELEGENNTNETNELNTVTNESSAKNDTNTKPKVVDAPYYIKVNYGANVVTVYKKDSKGNYTQAIKAMVCSVGTATPTSGVYGITDKYTWRLLEGNVYGQYACRITGSILFHSVPYQQKDKSTLEWWEYDKLGTKASLGCVRLKVEDAKWIYDNCVPGTKVEFYTSSTPGPLGKPTAKKITNDTEVRNWDPTDPDKNNPWIEYLKNQSQTTNTKPVEDNKNNNTENVAKPSDKNTVNNNIANSDNNIVDKDKNNTNTDINKGNTAVEGNTVKTQQTSGSVGKKENSLNKI